MPPGRATEKKPAKSRKETATVTVLARNRKARHDYHIEETIEAGLVLAGSEVKAIRSGKANLTDAFAEVTNGEAWLAHMDVGDYLFSRGRNHEARRRRKLLLHRREIDRLAGKVRAKGFTVVPLSLYDRGGHIKVDLALVSGKQEWDRRDDVKKREADREIARAMSRRRG